MRTAITFAIVYAVLTALVFFSQRRLLYLPGTHKISVQAARVQGLNFWPSLENHRGFIGAGQADPPRGTIIVFHGNAGAAYDRSFYLHALEPIGYRVILAEYPGYGGRAGTPSEQALVDDAEETIKRAHREFGSPIYLWGESLGAGVAAAAVTSKHKAPIAGIVLAMPWDSLPNLAQSIYWFLPARWLVLDKFDNINNLQDFRGPIAVLVAEHDEIIPRRHSTALYESLNDPKRLWEFPNAGHNNWPIEPTAPWWGEVVDYLAQTADLESR